MSEWIKWNGGPCPVDEHCMVYVRVLPFGMRHMAMAKNVDWITRPGVIEYQVVETSVEKELMHIQPTGTEAAVCLDIAKRQKLGLKKYGVSVRDNPLKFRQWLQHAYEETLDEAIYLKRAIEELDKVNHG